MWKYIFPQYNVLIKKRDFGIRPRKETNERENIGSNKKI